MTWFRTIRRAGVAAVVAAALAVAASAVAAEAPRFEAPAVRVSHDTSGVFHVRATFRVATSEAVAWAVLTDYDNLPAFVPSMQSSQATRPQGRLVVEQEASGRIGPFTRTMHVVLEVEEEPHARIVFRDTCGRSFYSYSGTWSIAPDRGGLLVTYTLSANPHRDPPLFAKTIVSSNARTFLDQLRREMLRRERAARSLASAAVPSAR